MPPSEYQLDHVAVNLIERMEGARRTWIDDPDAARAGFRRIADESIARAVAEYEGVMGADGWGDVLRREMTETFLPRYTRLALAHNDREAGRFGAWRGGDPVGRIVMTVGALLLAMVLRRIFMMHPVTFLFYFLAVLTPVMPEIRGWYYRRQYEAELQVVVDDLQRIQGELDRYAGPEGYTDTRLEAARRAVAAAAQNHTKEMG